LYRHTIQITESLTPKEAFEKARRLGQEWEEEYESIINETSRKTDIAVYKWEILLLDEKYPLIRKQLEKNYFDKPEFKQAFDDQANLFIGRLLKKKCVIEDREKALSLCLDYLIEECAVFIVMNNKFFRYTHFVYPGPVSKAIQVSFDSYNLKISIVRPEFEDIEVRPAQHIDSPLNEEDIWQRIHTLDEKAKFFADMRDVFSNCKVFCLKRAASNIRHRVAMQIDAHVMRHENNFILYKTLDIKYDVLIYAPKNKYPINKFEGESSKKYIPSIRIDYRALTSLSESPFPNCGVVDLRPLENEEVKKCELMMHFISLPSDNTFNLEMPLKDICEATEFIYSYLVYHANAPEAKFYIVGNEGAECKLYYSSIDSATDKGVARRKITDYLLKLQGRDQMLLTTTTEDSLGAQEVVHVSDPIILVKTIFDFFKLLRASQNIGSAPSTPNHSASSTPFGSPRSSPLQSSRLLSARSPQSLGSVIDSMGSVIDSMDSFHLGRSTSSETILSGDTMMALKPQLFFGNGRNQVDAYEHSIKKSVPELKSEKSDLSSAENKGVPTGLFFTPTRSCAFAVLVPAAAIGFVALALQAAYPFKPS